jgi:hypothetical protein
MNPCSSPHSWNHALLKQSTKSGKEYFSCVKCNLIFLPRAISRLEVK